VIKKLKGFGKVFVDLKLHDIPSTVEHEVKALVAHGAAIVSVHASGGRDMLEAAVRAGGTTIAAVTVLSSMSKGEARKASHLATHAHAAGVTSLICSPHELGALKKLGRARLITPGIRSPGARMHDQARTMPAREALARGADLLVIGRPITESDKPLDVLFELVES
jgi:orotidine-5'-phosphate decarboxylase